MCRSDREKATAAVGKVGPPKMEIPTMGWWATFFDPEGVPNMIYEPLEK